MKTKFVVTMIAIIWVVDGESARSKTVEMDAAWDSTKIAIDGSAVDWRGIPATYLEQQNASIAVASDERFVYLLFRTNDRKWARAIKATGLTLYLDPTGGKKRDIYVRFRGGPSQEDLMKRMQDEGMRAPEDFERPDMNRDQVPGERRSDEPILTCFIKDRITEKMIPLNGDEGPAAAFDTSKGFYQYELRVPLIRDSVRFYGIDSKPGGKLGVTLVWGDMSGMRQRPKEGMKLGFGGPVGGDPGGGMGGPPGGGMGGPPPGGMGGPGGMRGQMPQKQEVFIKTTLATEPK